MKTLIFILAFSCLGHSQQDSMGDIEQICSIVNGYRSGINQKNIIIKVGKEFGYSTDRTQTALNKAVEKDMITVVDRNTDKIYLPKGSETNLYTVTKIEPVKTPALEQTVAQQSKDMREDFVVSNDKFNALGDWHTFQGWLGVITSGVSITCIVISANGSGWTGYHTTAIIPIAGFTLPVSIWELWLGNKLKK